MIKCKSWLRPTTSIYNEESKLIIDSHFLVCARSFAVNFLRFSSGRALLKIISEMTHELLTLSCLSKRRNTLEDYWRGQYGKLNSHIDISVQLDKAIRICVIASKALISFNGNSPSKLSLLILLVLLAFA